MNELFSTYSKTIVKLKFGTMMANIHQLKEVEDCVERLEQLNQNENDLKEALRLVGEEKATVMKRENHLKHTTRYLTSYPKTNKSVPF